MVVVLSLGLVDVSGLVTSGLVVVTLVVSGLVVSGLVVSGLVVSGLVVSGLVVSGLVVSGLVVVTACVADPEPVPTAAVALPDPVPTFALPAPLPLALPAAPPLPTDGVSVLGLSPHSTGVVLPPGRSSFCSHFALLGPSSFTLREPALTGISWPSLTVAIFLSST